MVEQKIIAGPVYGAEPDGSDWITVDLEPGIRDRRDLLLWLQEIRYVLRNDYMLPSFALVDSAIQDVVNNWDRMGELDNWEPPA